MKKKLLKTLALCSLLTFSSVASIGLTSCGSEATFVTDTQAIKGNVLNAKLFVSYNVDVKLGGDKDAIKVTIDNPTNVKVRASGKRLIIKALKKGEYKLSVSLVSDPNKKAELNIVAVPGEETYRLQAENTTTVFKKGQTFQIPNIEVFRKLYVDGIETDTYSILSKKDYEVVAKLDNKIVSVGQVLDTTGNYKAEVSARGSESFTFDVTVADNDAYPAIQYFDELMKGNYTACSVGEDPETHKPTISYDRFVTLDYVLDASNGCGYYDEGGKIRKFEVVPTIQGDQIVGHEYVGKDYIYKEVNQPCENFVESEHILGYENTANFNRAWLDDIQFINRTADGKASYKLPKELSMFLLKLNGFKYADVNFEFKEAVIVIDEAKDVPFGICSIVIYIPVSQTQVQQKEIRLLFANIGNTAGYEGLEQFVFDPNKKIDLTCNDAILKSVIDGVGNGNFVANVKADGNPFLDVTYNDNYIDLQIHDKQNTFHQGYIASNGKNYPLLDKGVHVYGSNADGSIVLGEKIPNTDGTFDGLGMQDPETGVTYGLSPKTWQGFANLEYSKLLFGLEQGFYGHWNDIGIVNVLPQDNDQTKVGYIVYQYTAKSEQIANALVSGMLYLDKNAMAQNGIKLEGAYIDTTLKVVNPQTNELELNKITLGITVSIPGELGKLVLEFPGIEATLGNFGTAKNDAIDKFLSQYLDTATAQVK